MSGKEKKEKKKKKKEKKKKEIRRMKTREFTNGHSGRETVRVEDDVRLDASDGNRHVLRWVEHAGGKVEE